MMSWKSSPFESSDESTFLRAFFLELAADALASALDENPSDLSTVTVAEVRDRVARVVRTGMAIGIRSSSLLSSSAETMFSSSPSTDMCSMSIDTDREELEEAAALARAERTGRGVAEELEDEGPEAEDAVPEEEAPWAGSGGGAGAGAGFARRIPRSFKKLVNALVGPRTLLT